MAVIQPQIEGPDSVLKTISMFFAQALRCAAACYATSNRIIPADLTIGRFTELSVQTQRCQATRHHQACNLLLLPRDPLCPAALSLPGIINRLPLPETKDPSLRSAVLQPGDWAASCPMVGAVCFSGYRQKVRCLAIVPCSVPIGDLYDQSCWPTPDDGDCSNASRRLSLSVSMGLERGPLVPSQHLSSLDLPKLDL